MSDYWQLHFFVLGVVIATTKAIMINGAHVHSLSASLTGQIVWLKQLTAYGKRAERMNVFSI